MISTGKFFVAWLTTTLLLLAPVVSPSALAQTPRNESSRHIVSTAELQRDVAAAAAARRADEAKVEAFLSTPRARRAIAKTGMDYRVVRRGIPLLSQTELASLAARADKAQREFKAGALTNQQITYIIIALATAVIVIILVKA